MDVNSGDLIGLKAAYITTLADLPACFDRGPCRPAAPARAFSQLTDHRGTQPNSCEEDYSRLCTGVQREVSSR
jgi:hypothetical protein